MSIIFLLKLIIEKSGLKDQFEWVYCNTSNEVAATYKKVKSVDNIQIINPKKGFYDWLKNDKKYFLPTRLTRSCCAKFKEGGLKKHFDKNEHLIMVLGVRKFESAKRSGYDYVMDYTFRSKNHKNNNIPKKWVNIAPIINWTDVDVWLYIMRENIEYNELYNKGYNRVGCIICPYQHDYIDILTRENYPHISKRWDSILKESYKRYRVWDNFHWTFDEYKNSKWKTGTSKDGELIKLKATKERINELAKLKGIDKSLAEKYFKKDCCICGKKITNPHAIGMSLKLNRNSSSFYCKKCLGEKLGLNNKELNLLIRQYKEGGCNLF